MKVTQNPLPNTSTLENTSAAEKAGRKNINPASTTAKLPAVDGDSGVQISDQARMMKSAREIVYGTSDKQSDKVADIKRRIKDGTYSVDSAAVADKLVDEHLASNFGKNNL